MPITQYLHHQRFSPAAIRLRAMTNETETLTSGIDPASFSSVIKPTNDLFRYVNGPWIDTYRLPDDRSRYGSFDKLAEDAETKYATSSTPTTARLSSLRPCTTHSSTPTP